VSDVTFNVLSLMLLITPSTLLSHRVQYHSFDRLSITSICPDYSLKIRKMALDQSK